MDTRCPDCRERRCVCNLDPDRREPLPTRGEALDRLLWEEFYARSAGMTVSDYRRGLEEMTP